MSEPTTIPITTFLDDLRARGYLMTGNDDLLCACGRILALELHGGHGENRACWHGEHRPGWHDSPNWQQWVHWVIPPGFPPDTLPTVETFGGWWLRPDPQQPSKRWTMDVDLRVHPEAALARHFDYACDALGWPPDNTRIDDIAGYIATIGVVAWTVSRHPDAHFNLDVRYEPEGRPGTRLHVATPDIAAGLAMVALHVAWDLGGEIPAAEWTTDDRA